MFGNCAASVVPLPSGASHLPVNVPPTPDENGAKVWSFGLLSLKGEPKKPQTTGPLTPGATDAPAWMCAASRSSLVSAVCVLVMSMLLTVAVIVMAVCAALRRNLAVPKEAGRAAPVVVVGVVGGTSCEFVRLTTKRRTWLGAIPAFVKSLSTYCAFVSVDGNALMNSGRFKKSLK